MNGCWVSLGEVCHNEGVAPKPPCDCRGCKHGTTHFHCMEDTNLSANALLLTTEWKLGRSVAQTRNADCLQNKSGFSQFTMLFLKLNFCFRFKVKWSLFVGLITVLLLFGEQLVSDCRQVAVFHANCGESK